jgi:hypothetical protein
MPGNEVVPSQLKSRNKYIYLVFSLLALLMVGTIVS